MIDLAGHRDVAIEVVPGGLAKERSTRCETDQEGADDLRDSELLFSAVVGEAFDGLRDLAEIVREGFGRDLDDDAHAREEILFGDGSIAWDMFAESFGCGFGELMTLSQGELLDASCQVVGGPEGSCHFRHRGIRRLFA